MNFLNKYMRMFLGISALLGLMIVVGYGQNNGGSGKGSGNPPTPPGSSTFTDSLAMSQSNIETGGSEVILAVVKNTGSSTATFKIGTMVFDPDSNGPAAAEQVNTMSLSAGESYTQTMPFTPRTAGSYGVVSTLSINSTVADTKTGAFNALAF
jgi:hypothetical protein